MEMKIKMENTTNLKVQYFDDMGGDLHSAPMLGAGDALTAAADEDGARAKDQGPGTFQEFMNNVKKLGSGAVGSASNLPSLSIDDVSRGEGAWMRSYRDAVNNRRVDLLAQVLNNCKGDRILMSVDDIDNIKSPIVSELLQRRLSGDIEIGKPVLKYDTYYERVQVDMNM